MNNRRVNTLHYIVLSFMALTFVLPLVWLVIASLDPNASDSLKAPATWSLSNYISVLTNPKNLNAYWVGFVISFVESIIVVILSCLAAYPLSVHDSSSHDCGYRTCLQNVLKLGDLKYPVGRYHVPDRLLPSIRTVADEELHGRSSKGA